MELIACAPGAKPPVDMVVLAYSPGDQKYEAAEVQLQTLTDLTGMSGNAATMVGGAQIVVDPSDPTLQGATTLDEVRAAILKSPGGPVSVNLTSSSDSSGKPVFYPADFQAWNIASVYYNFEQAFLFYTQTLGLPPDEVTPAPDVFYFPDYLVGTGAAQRQQTDNAAYFPLLQSFLVLPFVDLQSIPLSMNLGVMAHEYTHSIVDVRVFNRNQVNIYSAWDAAGASAPNVMVSFDEGNADLMGAILTCGPAFDHCNTQFIADSIPSVRDSRDLDQCHCSDSSIVTQMSSSTLDDWRASGNQYVVGTWFSSAVWRGIRGSALAPQPPPPANVEAIANASFKWMTTGDGNNPGLKEIVDSSQSAGNGVTLDAVLNAFAAQISDPALHRSVCAAFQDRFAEALQATSATLPNCAGITPYTDCPCH